MRDIPQNNITVIGFTGGPCGGKSTGIVRIKKSLEGKGYDVLTLPEAATHFFTSLGMEMGEDQIDPTEFQEVLIPFQKSHEDIVYSLATRYERDVVIILDRTLLDSLAYTSQDIFKRVLEPLGISYDDLFTRYDAIVHFVTAADGAEDFYTLKNNKARRESPQEARELDTKIISVYKQAQNFHIIDNSTDFDTKIRRAEEILFGVLGIK